ncbi:MAG: AMIN domain-containing protein, partial [Elainella sp.]
MQSANWASWATLGLTTTGLASLTAIVAGAVAPSPAAALENWQFNADTQQLVISLPKGVTPRYHLVAEPARIVLDLPHTEVGAAQQIYRGAIQQIRAAQFQPDLARIVLQLSPEAVLAPGQVELQPLASDPADPIQRWALRPLLVGAPSQNHTAATPESLGMSVQPALLTADSAPPVVQPSGQPLMQPLVQPSVQPSVQAPAEPAIENSAERPASTPAPATPPVASPAVPNLTPDPLPVVPSLGPARQEPVALAPNVVLIPMPATPAALPNSLPPLEPGAVEIPVELSTAASPFGQAQAAALPAALPPASLPSASLPSTSLPSTSPPALPTAPPQLSASPSGAPAELEQAELEQATGTAAALGAPNASTNLAVSSARSSSAGVVAPVIPSTGTLSFPTPTAIAVNVPALSTVPQAIEPETESANPARDQR